MLTEVRCQRPAVNCAIGHSMLSIPFYLRVPPLTFSVKSNLSANNFQLECIHIWLEIVQIFVVRDVNFL